MRTSTNSTYNSAIFQWFPYGFANSQSIIRKIRSPEWNGRDLWCLDGWLSIASGCACSQEWQDEHPLALIEMIGNWQHAPGVQKNFKGPCFLQPSCTETGKAGCKSAILLVIWVVWWVFSRKFRRWPFRVKGSYLNQKYSSTRPDEHLWANGTHVQH